MNKKNMIYMIKCFFKILLAGIITIVILSAFCFIYDFSGVHISNPAGSTDYKWECGQWKANMSEGLAWLRMDENGFNNVDAEDTNVDILLMGSSNMEAVQVAPTENAAYLLNQQISDSVYNIGVSGHTIDVCVRNVEAAMNEFDPAAYVIMETNSVELSQKNMQSVLDGTAERIPSYDDGIIYYAQKYIPAVKCIYKRISDWGSMKSRGDDLEVNNSSCEDEVFDRDYIQTLNDFIGKASEPVSRNGCKLIILYHSPVSVDDNGNWVDTTDSEALGLFESACEANDVIFVDMTDEFKTLYEEKHVLPYGFPNTVVGAGHLNKYGHRVIADTLAERIREDER